MKKLILCSLLVSVAFPLNAKNLTITLDLYESYGTMNQEQKNNLFNRPIVGEAFYLPRHSIVGVTGSIKKCGFLSFPCFKKKSKQIQINAVKNLATNTLTFQVPLSTGTLYKLESFTVIIPFKHNISSSDGLVIRASGSEHHRLIQPVSIGNGFEGLKGTLRFSQSGFSTLDTVAGAIDPNQTPPYQFFKTHPYLGYFTNQNIRAIPNYISSDLKSPYPAEIANLEKIYSAKRFDAQLDGHQFTAVDISAKQKKDLKCKSTFGDYKYTLFFIDGQLSYYSTTLADMRTCETRYTTAIWNEHGEVYDYQVHKSSSAQPFQYGGWRNTCNIENNSNIGFCNIQPPDQHALKHFEKEANRVLHFFPTP
ncbi:MAG: hypothetical protein VX125_08385 [Pseudomonadota bacterium]|uniref:Uncharacterized protein n=1 Tax=Acinetobacter bereziniae TaxID=106648 RepID=A0A8I1DHZ3_ACIBZ|nr:MULTISPECIES: hypothetical protein [Acinetobacter]MEC8123848.1 hypothetical protein [Pseudomonadota bacterium]MBJ9949966.1 hypothetical protein [Acinetobacter bereziniae]QQC82898.1 hypothetical protein I9190_11240 [Acinetobacter bereziniae]UUN96042.1 hypothetical protein I9054_011655 [Acinetobacter bereziniae]BCX74065.1 hypothetical protein TOL5_22650 [Acinetobacter sp. Tol 5]